MKQFAYLWLMMIRRIIDWACVHRLLVPIIWSESWRFMNNRCNNCYEKVYKTRRHNLYVLCLCGWYDQRRNALFSKDVFVSYTTIKETVELTYIKQLALSLYQMLNTSTSADHILRKKYLLQTTPKLLHKYCKRNRWQK